MDRRKSLKVIAVGTVSAGVLLDGCKTDDKKPGQAAATTQQGGSNGKLPAGRMQEEYDHQQSVLNEHQYFNDHEMETITILADIIIPKDDVSGSASDAKVPEFIEYIVKDMPQHKLPMRGGLQWLDQQCYKQFNKAFSKCSSKQQIEMVDQIAYPEDAKKGMEPGVAFFSLIRDLTASGFYTSQIGVADIGYAGNKPNMWNGVPDDVLKQYGLSYTEQEMKECATYS